jgi:hypothetical protein
MKRSFVLFAAVGYALAAFSTAAIAAPKAAKAKPSAKAGATIKCPACGMPMPMKKTAMMTVPVHVGKKTYYCCPMCPAGKQAAAAAHGKKPMAHGKMKKM